MDGSIRSDGPLHSAGPSPTTSFTAARPRAMLDIRMFPHIVDMILSHCDTSTLGRMRLSRSLYRKITPMLAHTVPGCDGDGCGGLAGGDGGCPYWKWKEREQDDNVKWPYDTVKIVQVLQPVMADDVPLRGLPMGIERAKRIVLPVNARIVKDMHFDDSAAGASLPRLVWYPTDTHPGADYMESSMIGMASQVVINYRRWTGSPGASSSLEAMATFLDSVSRSCMARITLVAPPVGIYEYVTETLKLLPSYGDPVNDQDDDEDEDEDEDDSSADDYLLVYPERARPREPIHRLTVEEYADSIGSLSNSSSQAHRLKGSDGERFLFRQS